METGYDYRVTATWKSGEYYDIFVRLFKDDEATYFQEIDDYGDAGSEQAMVTEFRATSATYCYVNISDYTMNNVGSYGLSVEKLTP